MQVKILEIFRHSEDIWSFRLERPGEFDFKPGQFVLLTAQIAGQDVRRAYSISSPPFERAHLEITVRLKPTGLFTPVLFKMNAGDTIEIKGPFGIFHFDEANDKIPMFIAGGTGIAPLLSMLRTYLNSPPTDAKTFYLFYGIKRKEDEAFKQELAQMTMEHERFREIISVSEPDENWQSERGHMTYDIVKKHVVNPNECVFYICGPEAMVNHIIEDLHMHGIPDCQIKIDHW